MPVSNDHPCAFGAVHPADPATATAAGDDVDADCDFGNVDCDLSEVPMDEGHAGVERKVRLCCWLLPTSTVLFMLSL